MIGKPVVEVAATAGLFASKGEARRLVQQGGLYLNNQRVADVGRAVGDGDLIEGRLLVLRAGRKNYHLVKIR